MAIWNDQTVTRISVYTRPTKPVDLAMADIQWPRPLNLNDPNEVVVLIICVVVGVFCGIPLCILCCACVTHGLGANPRDSKSYKLLAKPTIPVDISLEYV